MEPETVTVMRTAQESVCRSLVITIEAMLSDRVPMNSRAIAEHAAALAHLQKAHDITHRRTGGEEERTAPLTQAILDDLMADLMRSRSAPPFN